MKISKYNSIYRVIALFIVLALMIGGFDAISPAGYSFADSEKSVTIYTSRLSEEGAPSYSFYTGFGIDTLVTPASATGYSITWESSDPDVADVDENGRVVAMLTGPYESEDSASCTITAVCRFNGEEKTDSIKVNVKRGADITGCYFFNSIDMPLPGFSSVSSLASDEAESAAGIASADESGSTEAITESLEQDHAEGELLVVFKDDTGNSEIRRIISGNDADVEQISPLGDDQKFALATAESEDSLQEVMENLSENESVEYVQPNYIYKLDDESAGNGEAEEPDAVDGQEGESDPDVYIEDPFYSKQHFHNMINTKAAWDLLDSKGIDRKTIVGVVDSGVDADHEDLEENLLLEDGKYTTFLRDGTHEQADSDIVGHGTHVSGIIGAVYGNGKGGAGVAAGSSNNRCSILPVGIMSDGQYFYTSAAIEGISYAVEQGARVINMSFGSPSKDKALCKTITDCYYNDGVVFVASAGNKESNECLADDSNGTNRIECISYPADLKEVIGVCNVDTSGRKHYSSYSGICKDISAPGTNIYSTDSNNGYSYKFGTSMAAPMVSAVAALIFDANPELTPQEARNIICATANDSKGLCRSSEAGYGVIDAEACVQAALDAREYAHSGEFDFSIKGYYNGEPDPYVLDKRTIVKKTRSLTGISSFKATGAKRKASLSFKRSRIVTVAKTTINTTYITGKVKTETSSNTTKSKSAVKYKIRVRYGGKTRYYYIYPKKKSNSVYSVSVKGDTIKVNIKKFGSKRLKTGRKCRIAIRSYKTIDDTTIVSKWTKTKTIKIK